MNPWFLAAAVFGAIGLLTELFEEGKSAPKVFTKTEKSKKPTGKPAAPVTVNVQQTPVQSQKEPKQKPKEKPSAKVPEKPSDG